MTTATAVVLVLAFVAGACGTAPDTGEVSAKSGDYGASIATSTTIAGDDVAAKIADLTAGSPNRAKATANLLKAIEEDPSLLGRLDSLTPAELEELTGVESEELGTLGITPATVAALGGAINQIGGDEASTLDPAVVAAIAANGGKLTDDSGQLTDEARLILGDIDPATFAALVAAAVTVDSSVTEPLGDVLAILDPNGLGQFQGDNSALAVIAVLMGAVLGRDPVALDQLANSKDIDPALRGLLFGLANIASTLTPKFVEQLNQITNVLGPYALRALGAAVGLLGRPQVSDAVAKAFEDEVVVSTAVGSMILLIPGLPQLVAPDAFADPNAIYGAVLGVAATALVNMDAPGFRDFLTSIGVVIPPDLLD